MREDTIEKRGKGDVLFRGIRVSAPGGTEDCFGELTTGKIQSSFKVQRKSLQCSALSASPSFSKPVVDPNTSMLLHRATQVVYVYAIGSVQLGSFDVGIRFVILFFIAEQNR